jgi:hypothetical protein
MMKHYSLNPRIISNEILMLAENGKFQGAGCASVEIKSTDLLLSLDDFDGILLSALSRLNGEPKIDIPKFANEAAITKNDFGIACAWFDGTHADTFALYVSYIAN